MSITYGKDQILEFPFVEFFLFAATKSTLMVQESISLEILEKLSLRNNPCKIKLRSFA